MSEVVLQTDLGDHLEFVSRGKVREIWKIDEEKLLFVATDRISAYDVILANGVPHKGALLTLMSVHWFRVLSEMIPHLKTHFLSQELPSSLAHSRETVNMLRQRSMQVRKLNVLPIESIVRGYITGSAWSEYKKSGTVHGLAMPQGLQESQKLDQPLWTPSTKADQGEHDENISPEKARDLIGEKYARQIEELSLDVYNKARDYAAQRGIIIADTKLEFAVDPTDDSIVLVDEVLTPDSSRFWPTDEYQVGKSQSSLDKQRLRDWLTASGLKGKEGVSMTPDIAQQTFNGYRKAFEMLVGEAWDEVISR